MVLAMSENIPIPIVSRGSREPKKVHVLISSLLMTSGVEARNQLLVPLHNHQDSHSTSEASQKISTLGIRRLASTSNETLAFN